MRSWDQVRVLPHDTALMSLVVHPASTRLVLGGAGYDEVPDTGWTMLIAWLAGAEHLVRLPDRRTHTVRVATVAGTSVEPRTPADQHGIDRDVEEYLADAQVPGPPRGYRWYQRVPEGSGSLAEVYSRVNASLRDADPRGEAFRPRQLAPLMADVVSGLYPGRPG